MYLIIFKVNASVNAARHKIVLQNARLTVIYAMPAKKNNAMQFYLSILKNKNIVGQLLAKIENKVFVFLELYPTTL